MGKRTKDKARVPIPEDTLLVQLGGKQQKKQTPGTQHRRIQEEVLLWAHGVRSRQEAVRLWALEEARLWALREVRMWGQGQRRRALRMRCSGGSGGEGQRSG